MDLANKEIFFFERIVPNYRVDIYEILNKKYNIVSCHSKEHKRSSLKDCYNLMNYKNILLPRLYIGGICFQNIFGILLKKKPRKVITEFALNYPTMWLLFLLRGIFKYKLILHTHGVKNNILDCYENKTWFKVAVKFYNRADSIIVYSNNRNEIIKKYLKNKEKSFTANNTLNSVQLIKIVNELKSVDKGSIKKKYKILTKYNIVYIGRLTKSKRIDLIVDAYSYIKNNYRNIDVGLIIIGDGPEKDKILKLKQNVSNVYWFGEVTTNSKIGEILYVSDLLVIPGYIGLSIVHSFFFQTPAVICINPDGGPYHGPEAEYFKLYYNGIACKQDIIEIADKILSLFNNPNELEIMSANAFKTAMNEARVEDMLDGFEKAINYPA